MREAGRKLTIRMPDNPRLRTATVADLHIEPGTRVRAGTPIMTLVSHRRQHMVRAPRPGRVVPLVALEDQISGGDPLYILNIDEEALAEANRDARALVVAERGQKEVVAADPIEPIVRSQPKPAWSVEDFAARWGKPILAIALYVLACFALLPILNAVAREAGPALLAGLAAGSCLFALVIFHLYAPNTGSAPRLTVRLVSLSWIAISALAIFYRPDDPRDISLADAGAPLWRLLGAEETPSTAPPVAVAIPPAVTGSGVYAQVTFGPPVPDYTVPRSVLTPDDTVPEPHNVSVRGWARANPSGTEARLGFAQRDELPARPSDPVAVVFGQSAVLAEGGERLPEALALAALSADLGAPVETLSLPVALTTGVDAPTIADVAPVPSGSGATVVRVVQDTPLSSPLPAPAEAAPRPADRAQDWLTGTAIPVIRTGSAVLPELENPALYGTMTSARPEQMRAPSRLLGLSSPALILIGVLKSGEGDWMSDQAARLDPGLSGHPQTTGKPQDPLIRYAVVPAAQDPQEGEARIASALLTAPPGTRSIAILRSEARPAPSVADTGLGGIAAAPSAPVSLSSPEQVQLARAPGAVPVAPPNQPEPAPEYAERLFLYLYYDDPRLETHPGIGDEWEAMVSPDLGAAIGSSTVEAVKDVVQVNSWCPAATGGDGVTAALSDRIRLLQVRVRIDPLLVDLLEQELPIFDGSAPGFFHNKRPLLGARPGEPVMARARAYLQEVSARAAEAGPGGLYYDDPATLADALRAAGCQNVDWNDGAGPANRIGSAVNDQLGG